MSGGHGKACSRVATGVRGMQMRVIAGVFALVVVAGCLHERTVVTRLYFGLSAPSGEVSAAQFDAFVDSVITPRFPEGLTAYAARGQWRSGDGTVGKEPSMVVEIIHTASGKADARFAEVIASYKCAYDQQSVILLRVRPERVEF